MNDELEVLVPKEGMLPQGNTVIAKFKNGTPLWLLWDFHHAVEATDREMGHCTAWGNCSKLISEEKLCIYFRTGAKKIMLGTHKNDWSGLTISLPSSIGQ